MVETKTISELSSLAEQLNSQSNNLNRYIKALNDQLAALNIGLEFWDPTPIESSGLRYDSSYSPQRKFEEDVYLGYCKLEETWQLAIKTTVTDYVWNDDNREEDAVSEDEYAPLLKASRDIRLEATERFDSFLANLVEHTKRKLASLQRAEQLAKLK